MFKRYSSKIYILGIAILYSTQIFGMEQKQQSSKGILDSIVKFAKEFFGSKSSPEEYRFMRQLEQWTENDRKFTTFNLVMRESLSTPNAKFIKTLVGLADFENPKPIFTLKTSGILSLDFSRNGKYLALGMWGNTIQILDVTNIKAPKVRTILKGHNDSVRSVKFSPDDKNLASGSGDKTIKIWDIIDIDKPTLKATLQGHNGRVLSVQYSLDGKYLASAGDEDDKTIKIWNAQNLYNSSQPIMSWQAHNLMSLKFSHNSNILASGSIEGIIKAWDISNISKPILQFNINVSESPIFSVDYSSDDKYIVSSSAGEGKKKGTAKIWDIINKNNPTLKSNLVYESWVDWDQDFLEGYAPIPAIMRVTKFSPNNKFIAAALGKSIIIWNVEDISNPKYKAILNGHWGRIGDIAYSPNNKYLASISLDSSVDRNMNIWDVNFDVATQLTKLPDSRDGIIQYLLLSSILEFRKNQEDSKHKLYTQKPKPFKITYPKLNKIFNDIPTFLKNGLIKKKYVEVK